LFIAFPSEEAKDPGELKVIEPASEIAASVSTTSEGEYSAVIGSESEPVFAESELGDALYIKICGRADPTFPQLVSRGMDTAAQQASVVQNSVKAVGITIEACDAAKHDTLYRAVVSVNDALRYQAGEIEWATFQKLWKTS
jgi:hypothetical protein